MFYSCTTGHRDNASADVYKSIRVDLFLPVVYRIESELKRRFSTYTLNILSSLACVFCPSSYYEAVMLVLGLVSTVLAPVLGLVDNKDS